MVNLALMKRNEHLTSNCRLKQPARPITTLVLTCFFLSGAAALIFQVVWIRLLTHVFGSSTLAVATVWSVFMGGLALGSALGGRIVDRMKRDPLLAYAFCEVGVAVCAFVIPIVLLGYPRANAWLWRAFGDSTPLLVTVRFVLCSIILLPPTVLMGATLPILSRRVVDKSDELKRLGAKVGGLYAVNTFGAVVGVFAAGFWLLEALGLRKLNLLAIGMALVVPVLIGVALRVGRAPRWNPPTTLALDTRGDDVPLTIDARWVLIAFALSGALAMNLEVLYFRAMALVLGSSTQSFTLVLVVFLLGLGVGSALLTIARVAFPTGLTLGAIMPMAVKIYGGTVDRVGKDVGTLYAANTLGAILGSLAGGFLVLPLIGLRAGLLVSSAIYLVTGAVLAIRSPVALRRWASWTIAPTLLLFLMFLPGWDADKLTSGPFRLGLPKGTQSSIRNADLVYYRDGLISTITVRKFPHGYILYNNGKPDASSHADRTIQIQLGVVPALLHPGTELDALVIGYGSGMTVGAITQASHISAIDAVDIEASVFEAADRYFAQYSHAPGKNPKVARIVADGRNFLAAGGDTYDIIVSQPPDPWVAGVANLFTTEFYDLVLSRLAPEGIFCQWVQLYEFTPETLKLVYRTVKSKFPYSVALRPRGGDTMIIASREPLRFHLRELERRFRDSTLSAEMLRAELQSPYDLLARVLLAPDEIDAFTGDGSIATDDNALLEFAAQRDFLSGGNMAVRLSRQENIIWAFAPFGDLENLIVDWGAGPEKRERQLRLAQALVEHKKLREAARWRKRAGVW
jgi:spermidine synthase